MKSFKENNVTGSARSSASARRLRLQVLPSQSLGCREPGGAGFYSGRIMRASGFTVAEVVLALAVVAFGLVAVLGVLPIGLNSTRDNRDETIITQDMEYWMNAIRGGPLGLDAFNHVEWVEIHKGDKRYRAEYAKLRIDGSPDEISEWPVYIDEDGKRTIPPVQYRGTLKQASWRKDVIGWLSAPSDASRTNYAKITPLGGTLMNRLHSIRDVNGKEESYYLHEGGDLTFSYLLKTEISKAEGNAESLWEIKMTARWPILEDNILTGIPSTGPGMLVVASYINAKPERLVDLEELNSLPAPSSGPAQLNLGNLLRSMPAGEAIGGNDLKGFIKSSLGQIGNGAGVLELANGKIPSELLNALGASSKEDLNARLSGAQANAGLTKSLKELLERNGVMTGGSSNNPGQLGAILGKLYDDRSLMQQIRSSTGSSAASFEQLMGQLKQMQSYSETFGVLKNAAPNAGNFDQLLAQLLSNRQILRNLGVDTGNIGQFRTQLSQLEASSKTIHQLMNQFGGEEKSMENVMAQLRQKEANGNTMNQVNALLASNGKSPADLKALLAANETDIKANNLIEGLLGQGLKKLEEGGFVDTGNGGATPVKTNDSYGRYSLRSLEKGEDGDFGHFKEMWYFGPSLDED